VKTFRILLTLLLVALWPLATAHCSLEPLPGFSFLACGSAVSSNHAEDSCATDNCASVESGLFKTEDAPQIVPVPQLIPAAAAITLQLAANKPTEPGRLAFDAAPHGLSKLWRFTLRAALPPRAPSIRS